MLYYALALTQASGIKSTYSLALPRFVLRNFMRDLDGKATLGGLRLAANTAQWYFSSCFLLGGIQGFRTMVGWRIMADRTWAS